MQLINLKLLSKFHEARPTRSRLINKSLKSHILSLKVAELKYRHTQRERRSFQLLRKLRIILIKTVHLTSTVLRLKMIRKRLTAAFFW